MARAPRAVCRRCSEERIPEETRTSRRSKFHLPTGSKQSLRKTDAGRDPRDLDLVHDVCGKGRVTVCIDPETGPDHAEIFTLDPSPNATNSTRESWTNSILATNPPDDALGRNAGGLCGARSAAQQRAPSLQRRGIYQSVRDAVDGISSPPTSLLRSRTPRVENTHLNRTAYAFSCAFRTATRSSFRFARWTGPALGHSRVTAGSFRTPIYRAETSARGFRFATKASSRRGIFEADTTPNLTIRRAGQTIATVQAVNVAYRIVNLATRPSTVTTSIIWPDAVVRAGHHVLREMWIDKATSSAQIRCERFVDAGRSRSAIS